MRPLKSTLSMDAFIREIANREIANYMSSAESPALVIALISSIIAAGISGIVFVKLKWVIGLLAPFILSNLIYWMPVWLGEEPSEYISWAPLFITGWTLAGVSSSAIVLLTIHLFRKQMKR
ncbi:MAG: hypothetical protein ACFFD6_03820 [Candidatus Thorarchaeota archaeon]